jgi:YbgC/YbaW family acyl-CoA thioester hydrolase
MTSDPDGKPEGVPYASGARVSQASIRRRVRFYETDAAGIVHFSVFFRFMEEAECELWRSAGLRNAPTRDLSFPRVAASFDFRKPLRFDDEFEARIQIAEMRTKAIRYFCELTVGGEVAATGSMTIVCATAAPGQPPRAIPIPAEIAGRFEAATVPRP